MHTRFIYVVGVNKTPVKIGIAVNPRERLAGLQIASPDALVMHHAIQTPDWAAQHVETAVHKAIAGRHVRGEWYDIDADEAAALVRQVARKIVDDARWDHVRRMGPVGDLIKDEVVSLADVDTIASYQRLLTSPDPAERAMAGHINALIMKAEGAAALTVFRMVIAERKNLPATLARDPVAYRNAKRALGRAIAVAADYIAFGREDALLKAVDKIQKTAA